MPSLPRRAARKARGALAAARRGSRHRRARTLLSAGVFDRSWYEAQTGRTYADDETAALDYLNEGRRAGRSPHPLLEPEWVAPTRWRSGRTDPAELYVEGLSARSGPHPVFDEVAWVTQHPESAYDPGSVLGHFLRTTDPDHPLPTTGPGPGTTLRALRAELDATLELLARQRLLASRRTSDSWDAAAEPPFVERWSAVELPTSDGGAPLVSVVMPVRNRRQQVVTAIRSVRQQTYGGWELVVVDDGSTDGTPEVVGQQVALDDRIVLVRGPAAGAAAARNTGLDHARGRYVAFLDSDNAWVPHFLQVALAAMEGEGLRVAHAVVELRSGTGVRYLAHQGGREQLEIVNHVDLNTLVVELALAREVGGFDPGLRRMIDWDLVVRLSRVVEPVLLPFVGVHYTDAPHDPATGGADRISVREPATWTQVLMARRLVDWDALDAGLAARVPGRVSVVLTLRDEWSGTLDLVDNALADGGDVEVVVVDRGSRPAAARMLTARAAVDPRVRFVRFPLDARPALGWSLGLPGTTGATLVLVDVTVRARPVDMISGVAWWRPLVAALDDPSVAAAGPLVVDRAGLVHATGFGRHTPDGLPYPMFEAAAPEDVAAGGALAVSALGDDALAVRAADLVAARGADPWYLTAGWGADLSARVAAPAPGRSDRRRLLVVPDATVIRLGTPPERAAADADGLLERVGPLLAAPPDWDEQAAWRRAGLELAGLDDSGRPALRRAPVTTSPPRLRWTVATAAPQSAHGDLWGDVHFSADLARALRRLGQYVVVERRESGSGEARSTQAYDDVFLNLRGLDAREPRAGQVNLLWVISHPDLVDADELRGYDAAFGAGARWARRTSDETGVEVRPLLQATDPHRFHPDVAEPDTGDAVLFVGNSRGVERPVVRDAVAAGLDLAVYGTRWGGRIDPRYLRGAYIPNDSVAAAYRSAGVLLNDHWPDMAAEGFISNRVFDAVAAGARVVSDPVDGLTEVFGGAVLQYATVDDLARWAGPERSKVFPDEDGLREAAAAVHREHSFDARATTLLETAARVRAELAGVVTP